MKAITLEQRARIYTLIQEGYSSREIAFCEKISHSTVVRIKQRKEKTGSFDIIPKPGRPRILSEQHDRNICRLIKSGECSNAIQIQKKLISNKNIIVSPNTIRRSLKRQEDWRKVIWSDESKFMIFGSDGRELCWKDPKSPLRPQHVKPTVKFGGGSVMIWGCFGSFGVGNY
ncbi:7260_t:CDS:2, partial [Entrophospora sp. SA101]